MSGFLALIPLAISAIGTTGAVGAAVAGVGSAVFAGAAAVTAGIGLTGTIGAIATAALGSAAIGAVTGGIGAAITGGDFLDGVKQGAIGGAISGGIGGALGLPMPGMGGQATANSMGGDVASGLTAAEAAQSTNLLASGIPNGAAGAAQIGVQAASAGPSVGLADTELGFSGFGSATKSAVDSVSKMPMSDLTGTGAPVATAPGTTPNSNGIFDGLMSKETLGGVVQGLGESLSGNDKRSLQDANNDAAYDRVKLQEDGSMARQNDAQDYVANNYSLGGGLLPMATRDQGAGRPTPSAAFARSIEAPNSGWEYTFDINTHSLKRKPAGT